MEMLAGSYSILRRIQERASICHNNFRTESDYDRGIRGLRVELQCCRRSKGLQSFTSGRVNYHESSDGAQFHLCFCFSDRTLGAVNLDYLWARGEKGGLVSGLDIGMYWIYPPSFTWVLHNGNIQINHYRFLVTSHQNTFQRLCRVGIDLLVRHIGRYVNEIPDRPRRQIQVSPHRMRA